MRLCRHRAEHEAGHYLGYDRDGLDRLDARAGDFIDHARTPSRGSMAGGAPAIPSRLINEQSAPGRPAAFTPHNVTAKQDTVNIDTGDIDAAAEELANSASGIGNWMRSAAGGDELTEVQWGGLDRDAQRALATVAGPLPFDLTFSLASADED